MSASFVFITVLSAAGAPDWDATFSSSDLIQRLPSTGEKIAVVGPSQGDHAAAAALVERWRPHSQLEVQLPQVPLAPDATDKAILAMAQGWGVAHVIIVRTYSSNPPSVVLMVYNDSQAVTDVITAQAGVPWAAQPQPSPTAHAPEASSTSPQPGGGPSQEAAKSIARITQSASETEEAYLSRYVWFPSQRNFSFGGWTVSEEVELLDPVYGKHAAPLRGEEFYNYIQHSEHAASYRSRSALKWSLRGVGWAACLGGTALAIGAIADPEGLFHGQDKAPFILSGIIASLVGINLSTWIPALIKSHPVDLPERLQLAETFNRDLRSQLGLARNPELEAPRNHTNAIASN